MSVKVTIPRDDYDPNQRTNIDVEVVNPDGTVSTKTVEGAVQATTQEDGSVSFGILASAHVPFVTGGGGDVTVVSSNSAYWTSSSGQALSLGATAVAGDIIVGFLGAHAGNAYTDPSGYTTLADTGFTGVSSDARVKGYYKVAAGGETSITLQSNGSQGKTGTAILLRGATVGNTATATEDVTASQSFTTATVTTTDSNELIVYALAGVRISATSGSTDSWPGVTTLQVVDTSTSRHGALGTEVQASAGTSTARTYTNADPDAFVWAGITAAFRPA